MSSHASYLIPPAIVIDNPARTPYLIGLSSFLPCDKKYMDAAIKKADGMPDNT